MNMEILNEMSQVYKEIPKDILTKLLDDKLITNRSSRIFHKEEFSYFYPCNASIVIFLSNKTDVIGGAYFELLTNKINNKIVYEEQIVSTFQEFYNSSNNLMLKIYLFLKELLNCSILSDEKHSEDSIRQWKLFHKKFNLSVLNAETNEIIPFKEEYFCKTKDCRKYRFLWN